jgi:alpha-amylase
MIGVCLYFQVHQPNRLKKYTYFDIGNIHNYENDEVNRNILLKICQKCYLPTNALLLKLIKKHYGVFKVAFSISGIAIEQFKKFSQETLDSFKELADTGQVEFLNETYYHSLSFLFSPSEFNEQVSLHHKLIKKEFGFTAKTFRNTELVYNNDLANFVEALGYKTILAEGADKILGWRSPNFVYRPSNCQKIKMLLRNYRLSDDVSFRFSNRNWSEFPLDAEKYSQWIHSLHGKANVVNLFMDYETFGEHQWQETGIFAFLEQLPKSLLRHPDLIFMTPMETHEAFEPIATLDVPNYISWADEERDLTAWRGNQLQEDSLQAIYSLEKPVKATGSKNLINIWRSLLTSDHFYYMCTKYSNDGDVHKYFNPYKNPYDAYINFQNILTDFHEEIKKHPKRQKQ